MPPVRGSWGAGRLIRPCPVCHRRRGGWLALQAPIDLDDPLDTCPHCRGDGWLEEAPVALQEPHG